MIALREISGSTDLIHENEVSNFIFNDDASSFKSLNYFQAVSVLFYIKNNPSYTVLKNNIKSLVLKKLSTQRASIYSETSHLLLDLIRCPYLDRAFKIKMIVSSSELEFGKKPAPSEVRAELKRISLGDWFVDWSENGIKIERLLQKKELKTPYE